MKFATYFCLTLAILNAGCQRNSEPAPPSVPAPPLAKSFVKPNDRGLFDQVGDSDELQRTIEILRPLHRKLGRPKSGDWLANHSEPGQSFTAYLKIKPVTPTGRRTIIYVQPLGKFTAQERQIVHLAAEYLGLYFNRPVKVLETLPPSTVPASARRTHPSWGVKQILTSYVLNNVLKPRLKLDSAAYIAFTSSDLWPGRGWNFVFGQASLRDRVGVWSLSRNGDPSVSKASFRLCLLRTLKVATHETGHMFSMYHCTAYECNMCGANHMEESDRHPLYLCPECHAKVCWATHANPIARLKQLAAFCQRNGLKEERKYFDRAIKKLAK